MIDMQIQTKNVDLKTEDNGEQPHEKTFKVLLEKMTPVYTFVTVTAKDEEEAAAKAEEKVWEEGNEWSHDRLPSDEVWSIIPPMDIAMPTEDEPPRVLGVCAEHADVLELACWGSGIVTSDGSIVAPHLIGASNSTPTKFA